MLVLDALMALWNRPPHISVVQLSNGGTQHTELTFERRCREAGVVPSNGQCGRRVRQRGVEAFSAALETELLRRQAPSVAGAAREAFFDYIDASNSHR